MSHSNFLLPARKLNNLYYHNIDFLIYSIYVDFGDRIFQQTKPFVFQWVQNVHHNCLQICFLYYYKAFFVKDLIKLGIRLAERHNVHQAISIARKSFQALILETYQLVFGQDRYRCHWSFNVISIRPCFFNDVIIFTKITNW